MRHLMLLVAAAATALSATPVSADLGDQLFKLLAKDGADGDRFGTSVAIGGTTSIIGAVLDDDNGGSSGSAYLFDNSTGQQIAKLLPDDGASVDQFGNSVGINGTTAIVGAFGDDDNGDHSGSAYLFDTATGQQLFKLLPNDGAEGDHFGQSVAVRGSIAIVGSRLDDDDGLNSGSAYLFDITSGQQVFKLLPDDGAESYKFGHSVAISGPPGKEVAIVGAHGGRNDDGLNSGSAYLFDISDPTNPTQIARLLANDGASADNFGWSVAISGSHGKGVAIVGSFHDDDAGQNSGSAYLFDVSTGQQITKLLPDDGEEHDNFGVSVSISSAAGVDVAIVGAQWDGENGNDSGSAYLFHISDPVKPKQIAKLLPKDGDEDDTFGHTVAISGGIAITGALFDDDNGNGSGSAYLFDAAATSTCPWDLDGTGAVGVSDLLTLLASWGPCKGCPADFDSDNIVGLSDLLALLANWGPCS